MFLKMKKITKIIFIFTGLLILRNQLTCNTTLKHRKENFKKISVAEKNANSKDLKKLTFEIKGLIEKIKVYSEKITENIDLIKDKTNELKILILEPAFLAMIQKLFKDLADPGFQKTLLLQSTGKYLRTTDLITINKMTKNNMGQKLNYFLVELTFNLVESVVEWLQNNIGEKISLVVQNNSTQEIVEVDLFNNSTIDIDGIKEKLNTIRKKLDQLKIKWNVIRPHISPIKIGQKLTKKDIDQFWHIISPIKLIVESTTKTLCNSFFGNISSIVPFKNKIKDPILLKKLLELAKEISEKLLEQTFSKSDILLIENLIVKKPNKTNETAPIGYKLLYGFDRLSGKKISTQVRENLISFFKKYYSKITQELF